MVEHRIGEIVRRGATTYICKLSPRPAQESSFSGLACDICALNKEDCFSYACNREMRSDGQRVYYEIVLEPREGMLFRASDGNLYRCTLKDSQSTAHDCACYVYCYRCSYIESEAFGLPGNHPLLHWVPVDESDMIERKLEPLCEQPFNNFFETAEEAAAALERVKNMLNEMKKNAE